MDSRETSTVATGRYWGLPCADERMGKEDFSGEGSQKQWAF